MSAKPVEVGVAGVEVGHWTDAEARTGCTVVVLPPGTVASGEVRGGAPATREFALLAPERLVDCVDAVVLTGGSAFGLAACDGVMEALEAEGRGFAAPHGPVPIVVGMALYDLGVGDPAVRPAATAGRTAAANRSPTVPTGRVGAGAGATVSKWRGRDRAADAGLGAAVVRRGALTVTALVAANAAGDPNPGLLAEITAGTFTDWPDPRLLTTLTPWPTPPWQWWSPTPRWTRPAASGRPRAATTAWPGPSCPPTPASTATR